METPTLDKADQLPVLSSQDLRLILQAFPHFNLIEALLAWRRWDMCARRPTPKTQLRSDMSFNTEIMGQIHDATRQSLLPDKAIEFLAHLQRLFNGRRKKLLHQRTLEQRKWDAGALPQLSEDTRAIREQDWQVASVPEDLLDRRVEITGPVDPKMMINALNSGARVYMADLEDSCAPNWQNILSGHEALNQAVRRTLAFTSKEGKQYQLKSKTATLVVRPRGWHLEEPRLRVDGEAMAASLFDAGLFLFHNASESIRRGSGPYLYLPKLESRHEAALWREVLAAASSYLGIPKDAIKVTVLIETITAAYEMEEILYELRDYIVGMNAGRWDYIFSVIKRFGKHKAHILPDREQVTMTVPFMRAYTQRLVTVCHKRKAHAIGGMSAFIPNRRDPELSRKAIAKVRQDKELEANAGFDGTWVAHPDLVSIAQEVFDKVLGTKAHQKDRPLDTDEIDPKKLIDTEIADTFISRSGVAANISVAIQYINKWLQGIGAVAINNLMEDAATAEISRAQLWQWIRHNCELKDGGQVNADLYRSLRSTELAKLRSRYGEQRFASASQILDELVLAEECGEFLTIPAYHQLEHHAPLPSNMEANYVHQ